MSENPYPSFDGWTVERTATDTVQTFRFTKGRDYVEVTAKAGVDPDLVYERGVRDCHMDDLRVAAMAANERGANLVREDGEKPHLFWTRIVQATGDRSGIDALKKFQASDLAVATRKVRNVAGRDIEGFRDYANDSLQRHGVAFEDRIALIDEIAATQNGG